MFATVGVLLRLYQTPETSNAGWHAKALLEFARSHTRRSISIVDVKWFGGCTLTSNSFEIHSLFVYIEIKGDGILMRLEENTAGCCEVSNLFFLGGLRLLIGSPLISKSIVQDCETLISRHFTHGPIEVSVHNQTDRDRCSNPVVCHTR